MAYPPSVPPTGRLNSTPQADNHPADHNQISSALSDIINEVSTKRLKNDGSVPATMLRLTNTNDVTLASTTHALQIGSSAGVNLAVDTDEIQARNNGKASTLALNPAGGATSIGGAVTVAGAIAVAGPANSTVGGQLIAGTNLVAGATPTPTADGSVIRADGLLMSTVITGDANSLPNLVLQRTGTAPAGVNGRYVEFRRANTADVIGRIEIQAGGSSIAYLTTSDRRLKDDQGPITDAVTRLSGLVPRRFTWKADPGFEQDGFFADEVTPVVPEAVSGEPGAVDTDGGIVAQALDTAKLVPLLVAAVQELTARIEELENR